VDRFPSVAGLEFAARLPSVSAPSILRFPLTRAVASACPDASGRAEVARPRRAVAARTVAVGSPHVRAGVGGFQRRDRREHVGRRVVVEALVTALDGVRLGRHAVHGRNPEPTSGDRTGDAGLAQALRCPCRPRPACVEADRREADCPRIELVFE
jgi:hypothetical protein